MAKTTPKFIARLVEDGLRMARFETASFHLPGNDRFTDSEKDTKAIREATQLYMESWVLPRLELALLAMTGDEAAVREAKEYSTKSYTKADRTLREKSPEYRAWVEGVR